MWWDIRGKRDAESVRYRVQAINQEVAEKLVQWKGIEILSIAAEQPRSGSQVTGALLDAFGPFVGDVPPTLSE